MRPHLAQTEGPAPSGHGPGRDVLAEERFRGLAELSPSALVGGRADGTVTFANAAVEPLLGWTTGELVGRSVTCMWPRRLRRRYAKLLLGIFDERPEQGPALEGEFVLCRRDGREFTARVSARWVDTEDGPIAICALTDLSERDRVERMLRTLAEVDPLTGLLNRRRFEEELSAHIGRAARQGDGGALLVLDLDQFKRVNDTLGHQAGDELLRGVAERLRRRLREGDVLGRLGGDEFAVLLPRVEDGRAGSVGEALLQELRDEPFVLTSRRVRVTASVGASVIAGRDLSTDALVSEADLAMYDAKEAGRDRVCFGAPARARLRARRSWADRIRRALTGDGFVLHAQPMVELETGASTRLELLLRIRAPGGGLALPEDFLPVAERFDLLADIDRWVTARAIELLSAGGASGPPPRRLHVNLSSATVGQLELPRFVEAAAREHGVDPGALTFEIAEAAAISDLEGARRFALAVRQLGAEVALTGFGRGFASFYCLKHLSVDVIKIAGDFVSDLTDDPMDRLVVRSIVEIARGLGLTTVAEFVADGATVGLLDEYGVDCAQGYHIAMPEPVEALAAVA